MKLSKDNFVIGITGGIGAGKSVALEILRNEFQAKVHYADWIANHITSVKGPFCKELRELFGQDCFDVDGLLAKKRVADIIFNDPDKLKTMNNLVHPAVRKYLRAQASEYKGLLVLEAALPVEAGLPDICDEIWYIYAEPEVRIARLMEGRGYTREKCISIMDKQISDEMFRSITDRVIDNSYDVEQLRSRIQSALKEINYKEYIR